MIKSKGYECYRLKLNDLIWELENIYSKDISVKLFLIIEYHNNRTSLNGRRTQNVIFNLPHILNGKGLVKIKTE